MTHAIELDPRHITGEDARRLAGLGVGRASLGVQTLDGAVQRAIARVQPLPVVAAAFASLRAAGITAINADLMYGLPLQSSAAFRDTVRQVLALAPSRFAIFGYAHVPWMKPHQKRIDEATLPDTRGRMLQAAPAREILAEGGYVAIGIDHFARPDDEPTAAFRARRLGRNFQGYTTDRAAALVGIGASAISRTPSGLAQNARDNAGWRRAIEAGRLPTVQGKAFTGDDVLRAAVIEELLCYFEVDLAEAARRHRAPLAAFADDVARLLPMAAAGWLEIEGSRLRIREHGHEIARVVASGFDAYLGRGGRHSLAA